MTKPWLAKQSRTADHLGSVDYGVSFALPDDRRHRLAQPMLATGQQNMIASSRSNTDVLSVYRILHPSSEYRLLIERTNDGQTSELRSSYDPRISAHLFGKRGVDMRS